jgi:ankyrin repeat protein
VKLLLERGADIRAMNGEGETPYQVSLRKGEREIADLLRNHGGGRPGERFDESIYDLIALSDWRFDFRP